MRVPVATLLLLLPAVAPLAHGDSLPVVGPDLDALEVLADPSGPYDGDRVDFTALFGFFEGFAHAFGLAPLPPTFRVEFWLDEALFDAREIPTDISGGFQVRARPWTAVAGAHGLRLVLDPDDRLEESDETNNEATSTFEVQGPYSVDPLRSIPSLHDAEHGLDGWAASGLWHLTEDRAASASHAWYFGLEHGPGTGDNDYDTGARARGVLVSPGFDLRDAAVASLSYWEFYRAEAGQWEHPVVQVNEGAGYETLFEEVGAAGEGARHLDLTPYVGHVVHVRFLWDTLDNQTNGFEGWYLDDLEVRAQPALPNPLPDLVVASVEPSYPLGSSLATLRITVENRGNAPSPGVDAGLSFDGGLGGDSTTLPALAAGQAAVWESGPFPALPGAHSVLVFVDSARHVAELDEGVWDENQLRVDFSAPGPL